MTKEYLIAAFVKVLSKAEGLPVHIDLDQGFRQVLLPLTTAQALPQQAVIAISSWLAGANTSLGRTPLVVQQIACCAESGIITAQFDRLPIAKTMLDRLAAELHLDQPLRPQEMHTLSVGQFGNVSIKIKPDRIRASLFGIYLCEAHGKELTVVAPSQAIGAAGIFLPLDQSLQTKAPSATDHAMA